MRKHAKIVFKEFGSSFGRFIAIAGIIALSMAFLIGINLTTPDIKTSFTEYFNDNALYDFSIRPNPNSESGILTFSDDDVTSIAALDGVGEVQAFFSLETYCNLEGSDKNFTVRLVVGDIENLKINKLTITDGNMPSESADVIAISPFGNMEQIELDSSITLKPSGKESMLFKEKEPKLTISAIATSPMYFSTINETCSVGDGNVDVILFAKEDIIWQLPTGMYTEIWVTAEDTASYTAFTDEYDNYAAEISDDLTNLGSTLGYDWYVLDRTTNLSYYSLMLNADKVANLAAVFPVFFIAVAALVAFSTIVRMVNEDRLQIGTLRSLGYAGSQIVGKYIFYSAAACVLGLAVGIPLGVTILPLTLWNAYGSMYALPSLVFTANPIFISVAAVSTLAATLLITAFACIPSLRETPAKLLQPLSPKPGKRILLERVKPVWNRMSFKYKATFRNIFRFKRNLIMTVLAVAGCSALILCGFALLNSTAAVTDLQFNEIYNYDMAIGVSSDYEESTELSEFLSDKAYVEVMKERGTATNGSNTENVNIIASEGNLTEFIKLDKEYNSSSVLISKGLAEEFELKEGDTIKVKNSNGKLGDFIITGVVTMYSDCWLFIGTDTYNDAYGENAASFNTLLVDSNIPLENQSEKAEELLSIDYVSSISYTSSEKVMFDNLSETIGLVTLVLVVCAGCLVVIVLYNLTNINICERKKEIATLKVLGYRRREVAGYIFREIMILVIIGIAVGIGLGVALSYFVLSSIEAAALLFPRVIYWWSYVLTIVLTLAFSGLVDLILLPKLNKIDMAESMKAVD